MTTSLRYGAYYHIYSRGNNGENLFIEEKNYHDFLGLYLKHIVPVADTYAYCLLRNHFHHLIRTKTEREQEEYWSALSVSEKVLLRSRRFKRMAAQHELLTIANDHPLLTFELREPSQAFANMFNAYTRTINRRYGRTGALFERPFGRVNVTSDRYFRALVVYIHQNPQKHGFVNDFRQWPFSSYSAIQSQGQTRVDRNQVLSWFNDHAGFQHAHQQLPAGRHLQHLVPEEF